MRTVHLVAAVFIMVLALCLSVWAMGPTGTEHPGIFMTGVAILFLAVFTVLEEPER